MQGGGGQFFGAPRARGSEVAASKKAKTRWRDTLLYWAARSFPRIAHKASAASNAGALWAFFCDRPNAGPLMKGGRGREGERGIRFHRREDEKAEVGGAPAEDVFSLLKPFNSEFHSAIDSARSEAQPCFTFPSGGEAGREAGWGRGTGVGSARAEGARSKGLLGSLLDQRDGWEMAKVFRSRLGDLRGELVVFGGGREVELSTDRFASRCWVWRVVAGWIFEFGF